MPSPTPTSGSRPCRPGGALDAAIEAREAGLVRFIGVTGHGWTVAAMHRRSLERFDFDSVLMPWNWFCAQHSTYPADFEATVSLCEQRRVAIQTIKAIARGPWAAGATRDRTTWYQPLEDEDDIRTAVRWVLARPGIFLNSVGDVGLLPAVLRAAATVRGARRGADGAPQRAGGLGHDLRPVGARIARRPWALSPAGRLARGLSVTLNRESSFPPLEAEFMLHRSNCFDH